MAVVAQADVQTYSLAVSTGNPARVVKTRTIRKEP